MKILNPIQEEKRWNVTLEDDIVFARYNSRDTFTLDDAKGFVEDRWEFTRDKPKKIISVFPNLSSATKPARDYMASDEAVKGILAAAIVTNSVIGRLIVNFYLGTNLGKNPGYPIKLFSNEVQAIKWINELDLEI